MNNLASFQLRLLASVIDYLIELMIFLVFVYFIVMQPNLPLAVSTIFICLVFFLNPVWIFKSIFLTYYFGGSFGKLLTGLRVTDEEHKHLSFKRVCFRQTIGYSFAWLVFGLGYVVIMKDKKRQGWHDQAVGSLVVVKSNQWIIGAVVGLLLLAVSWYLVQNSLHTLSKSPLRNEFPQTVNKLQKALDEANKQTTNQSKTNQTQYPVLPTPIQ